MRITSRPASAAASAARPDDDGARHPTVRMRRGGEAAPAVWSVEGLAAAGVRVAISYDPISDIWHTRGALTLVVIVVGRGVVRDSLPAAGRAAAAPLASGPDRRPPNFA